MSCGVDLAQADVDARDWPPASRESTSHVVEHRQRPQIDRMARHAPVDDARQGVEIRAAVVVDHALGVTGGARRVVEGDRIPLVGRVLPCEVRIAAGNEAFVIGRSQTLPAGPQRVDDVDHLRLGRQQRKRPTHGRGELGVGDEHLGLAMVQHERNRLCIESRVERVEHPARHRDAEMRFEHLRRIGGHHRHRIADADADMGESGCEPPASDVGFRPCVAPLAVHHRELPGIGIGSACYQRKGSQRRVILPDCDRDRRRRDLSGAWSRGSARIGQRGSGGRIDGFPPR